MVRLVLDEDLPARTASSLRGLGIDAIHATEAGLASAADEDVLDFARANERCCITLDLDFHRILANRFAGQPSVILLRVQGLDYEELAQLIVRILNRVEADLPRGVAVTATGRAIRLRFLPLK